MQKRSMIALALWLATSTASAEHRDLSTTFEFPASTGSRNTLFTFTAEPFSASGTPPIRTRILGEDGAFLAQHTTLGGRKTYTKRLVDIIAEINDLEYRECEGDPTSRTWIPADIAPAIDAEGNFSGKIELTALTESECDISENPPLPASGEVFSSTVFQLADAAEAATAVAIHAASSGCHELNYFIQFGETYTVFGIGSGDVSISIISESNDPCTFGAGQAETIDFTSIGGFTREFSDLLPSCAFGSANFCSVDPFFVFGIATAYRGRAQDVIRSVHGELSEISLPEPRPGDIVKGLPPNPR